MAWSALFRLVEQNKQSLGVIDYSVSQTTLDQVSWNPVTMDGWMDGCMDGWMDGWMDG